MEAPDTDMQGPITRACSCHLNLQVSSFLYTFCNYEIGMLPRDVIVVRNNGEDEEMFGGRLGREKVQAGCPSQAGVPQHPEFESSLEPRTLLHKWFLGAGKIDLKWWVLHPPLLIAAKNTISRGE